MKIHTFSKGALEVFIEHVKGWYTEADVETSCYSSWQCPVTRYT